MEPKNFLLLLFLFVVGYGVYGQKRPINNLPSTRASLDHVLDDVQPMDTIYHIEFATRVDSLYKYLDKDPKATWDIIFKDGIRKPDLQSGDILRVTSENNTIKYYFLKLEKYIPNTNAYLGSITWPDMPLDLKGEKAGVLGWKGDTIPSFDSLTMNYVLVLPLAYQRIPALTFATVNPNSKVMVTRAKSLEGSVADRTITFTVIAEDSITTRVYSVFLKKEQDTLDIQLKSTISSMFYKVSPGYSLNETIKGVINGTTVADFYAKITKADELQTLKVISAFSGAELDEADRINNGDTLVVLSADGKHTSKYILRGTFEVLSVGTMLTSTIYTIYVTGSTGIITGFPKYTPLKTVLEGVVIPSGATLTMVDQNDGYKTLIKLNYDTVYVDVLATLAIYFEVIAENGRDKVLYQLRPTSISVDAYATSDLYSINQISSFLYPLIQGTSVNGLFSNLTPAPGASMKVYDKEGFVRSTGIICKDDKLVVTSLDGTIRKAYYFKTPGFEGGPYLAFILSDDYQIDQVLRSIGGVSEGEGTAVFKSKLVPAFGATLKVVDINGNESTLTNLVPGDKVLVTSADGTQTTTYFIDIKTEVDRGDIASAISMVPNPSTGKVVVHGLAKGDRLRVLNPVGTVLFDVIAVSSAETISLDAQPAGIYLFVVSAGSQPLNIKKIMKK